MKITRFVCLAAALGALSIAPGMMAAPTPAISAPALSPDGLPPGAPPLTPAQKSQQQAIILRARQEATALQNNKKLSLQQKRQQALALGKSVDTQMMTLLTPAQRTAVEAQRNTVMGLKQQFIQQHHQEIQQQQQDAQRFQQLGQALEKSLTPAERSKRQSIANDANAQLKGLESNKKMTQQEKFATAGAIERDAERQAFNALTPAHQTQFRQVQAAGLKYQTDGQKLQTELIAFAKAHNVQ